MPITQNSPFHPPQIPLAKVRRFGGVADDAPPSSLPPPSSSSSYSPAGARGGAPAYGDMQFFNGRRDAPGAGAGEYGQPAPPPPPVPRQDEREEPGKYRLTS